MKIRNDKTVWFGIPAGTCFGRETERILSFFMDLILSLLLYLLFDGCPLLVADVYKLQYQLLMGDFFLNRDSSQLCLLLRVPLYQSVFIISPC